jgi:hypothetical protein
MTSTMPLEGYVRIGSVQPRGPAAVTLDGMPIDARGFDHFGTTKIQGSAR